MKSDAERYNGWTNYETWCVALWLDNDETSYRYWSLVAEQTRDDAQRCQQVKEKVWTTEQATRFNLADAIKSEITERSPTQDASLYTDLIHAALSEVDWGEIAQAILDR